LGTLASSTTKTGRHDIAEILLKVALKHQKSNQNQSRIAKKKIKKCSFSFINVSFFRIFEKR
jgi:hypothetical protein